MSVVHSEISNVSWLNLKSEAGVNGFSYSAAKAKQCDINATRGINVLN